MKYSNIKRSLFLVLFLFGSLYAMAFTVVIDAGHGGRDPGAVGSRLYEKDLNLWVATRLAEQIKAAYTDVDVYLTRSTDVFLSLKERAQFVNKHHADLFICIHTNAAESKKMNGVETFVMGLDKLDQNLDVAMRENSVMMLEENYQTTYQNFDPNSVESYIMFEFMQSEYLDKSLAFASFVQDELVAKTSRKNRGVQQAAFWVLHQSSCPSVLVEMGFISNAEEEKWLATTTGKQAVTDAIFDAFAKYRKSIDKVEPVIAHTQDAGYRTQDTGQRKEATEKTVKKEEPVFRVQIFSVRQPLQPNDPSFKGLKGCKYTKDGAYYKYTYGEETSYQKIVQLKNEVAKKFKDCFVVAFLGDEQIYVRDARKMTNQ